MIARTLKNPVSHRKSFFLLGPRGTGKTHWVKHALPNAIYLDLLRDDLHAELLASPLRLNDHIPPNYDGWVIIDEIQRIPNLLHEVHRLIENSNITFALTGSSARKLRKKGINLLAGRAYTYHMHPLTVEELGQQFNLQQALEQGMLPALLTEPSPATYLKSYIQTYLREEVAQEGLTRNLSAFHRFLEIASFSQGSILNVTDIAREASIHQKVAHSYFEILEDLLIGYRLPVFSKRAKRKTIARPKFYFFDNGIYRYLRPTGYLDTPNEIEGPGAETLFLQEVRALNDYHNLDYQIAYWRTTSGIEVDFILYGPNGFHAIEIKRSHNASRNDCKGLKRFSEDYPEATCHLLYMGEQTYYFDQVTAQPFKHFLTQLSTLLKRDSQCTG